MDDEESGDQDSSNLVASNKNYNNKKGQLKGGALNNPNKRRRKRLTFNKIEKLARELRQISNYHISGHSSQNFQLNPPQP